jgi:hypothetical protein
MGFFSFKKKKEAPSIPEPELEVPTVPKTKEELPPPKDVATIKAVKQAVERPRPMAPSVEEMEERAFESQKHELEEREGLKLTKPIFVSIENYKDMLTEMTLTQNIQKENEEAIDKLKDVEGYKEKKFDKWESQLQVLQKKLIYADKALFEIKE